MKSHGVTLKDLMSEIWVANMSIFQTKNTTFYKLIFLFFLEKKYTNL